MNLQIERTKQNITNNINNSGLPVGVVLLILKDLMVELNSLYFEALNNEQQDTNGINDYTEDEKEE